MSDAPNPWSREASAGQSGPQPWQQPGQQASSQHLGVGAQPGGWRPPAGAQSQPSAQPPLQPPHSAKTTPRRPRRAGRLTASVLGLTLLAGGVGAGSAVLTTRYLAGEPQPAITQRQDEGSSGQSAQGTTVKQADPHNPNWTAVAEVAQRSVVAIQAVSAKGGAQGSGVVIDKQGHIVTNNHVVNGARQLRVTLGDRTYDAELVGTDPSTDLAVIRLVDPPKDLHPMAWGDSNSLKVGDPVMAIGNPLGLSNTVTTGIVSALDRPVTTEAVKNDRSAEFGEPVSSETVVTAAIQTNAAINPGNSGGALVNASGELVGITSSIASLSSGGQGERSGSIGLGFAISAHQARHVARQLISSGKAVYPQIGIRASDPRETGQLGAQVATVVDGSPAAKAGLRAGDVVTAIAGRPVSSTSQLVGLVRAQEVGQSVELTYIRDGKEHTVEMQLVASGR